MFSFKVAFKRILSMALVFVVLTLTCISAIADTATQEASASQDTSVTVLFTHDLHSHLLPSVSEDGGEFGGYARLMTVINQQKEKYPDALLVDGGDFSMGSLFQTCFADEALELRMMGAMGYDATTFGNHEFDYLPEGLISMLNTAKDSGEYVPSILEANYLPPEKGEEGYNAEMWDALNNYGVQDYMIIERGGVYFVVFGINGFDSHNCAPNSGMILKDPAEVSQEVVNTAVAECKERYSAEPVVVCLSHSGTEDGEGEDYELAKAVDGIDLIISAHTHTTLTEAIEVDGTYIVSAGEYGKYLGVVNMDFSGETAKLESYELIPVDENVSEDTEIAQKVAQYKKNVDENYLSVYGCSFDEVLVNNSYKFDSVKEVYTPQHESTLGNLFADAYKAMAEATLGEEVDVALTAAGVIRETMPEGDVTVSDVFNAASLGVGTEGELIRVYITGKDLKNAFEVDASVQPIMTAAQLYFSGAEYSFNTKRMIFNKVDDCVLLRSDGTKEVIDDDKLYSVVTGMYAGQMLGSVEAKSFGLLSITARDKDGNPIDSKDFVNYVIRDDEGTALKEWYAIASYLKSMGGEMSEKYAAPDGRKNVYSSLSPVALLRNANVFTYVVLALILVIIAVVVLIVVTSVRRRKKKTQQNK